MWKRWLVLVMFLFVVACSPNEEETIPCEDPMVLVDGVCEMPEDEPEPNPVCDDGMEWTDEGCRIIETEEPPVCEEGFTLVEDQCVPNEMDENQPNEQGFWELEHNGRTREYLYYEPEDLAPEAPLVMVLHGFTSNAYNIQELSDFDSLADQEGFAVVYPQGWADPAPHWNAELTFTAIDDVGFLVALVEHLQLTYDLHPEHVFVAGFSNGGFMAYTLACRAPETFLGMASVSGLMSGITWDTCLSPDPIGLLHVHGTADLVVPSDGTMTTFGGWGGAPEIEAMLLRWREINQTWEATTVVVNDITTGYHYESTTGHPLWFYEIDGYPHAWPGPNDGVLELDEGFEATELIWTFFEGLLTND
jgi:polyhydroxybutyrate depolymerase